MIHNLSNTLLSYPRGYVIATLSTPHRVLQGPRYDLLAGINNVSAGNLALVCAKIPHVSYDAKLVSEERETYA